MSIPDNSHLKTIWEEHKERIQNQKVVCTQHTLCKIVAFKELDPEEKDYYCNTCFDVGKCGTLAVEEVHYHYVYQINRVKTDVCIKSKSTLQ